MLSIGSSVWHSLPMQYHVLEKRYTQVTNNQVSLSQDRMRRVFLNLNQPLALGRIHSLCTLAYQLCVSCQPGLRQCFWLWAS